MKTLNENELSMIEGCSAQTPSWPLQPCVPPVAHLLTSLVDLSAIVPSYLQG